MGDIIVARNEYMLNASDWYGFLAIIEMCDEEPINVRLVEAFD